MKKQVKGLGENKNDIETRAIGDAMLTLNNIKTIKVDGTDRIL